MRCAFISIFLALNFNLWLSWESARPWALLDDDGDFVHVKCYCCCCLVNGLLNSAGYINSFDYFKVSFIALGVNNTILKSKYVVPKISWHFQKRHLGIHFLSWIFVFFSVISFDKYQIQIISHIPKTVLHFKLWHPGTRNRLNLYINVSQLAQILH